MSKPYINYGAFELVCWDVDGEDTNIGIDLSPEEAKKICEAIGLIGFGKENGKIVSYHNIKTKKDSRD